MTRVWIVFAAAGAGLASGCAQDTTAPAVRNLDRPSDVAFACYGDYRVNGGVPGADDPPDLVVSAQPIQSCLDHATGTPPPGQQNQDGTPLAGTPALYAFVLQGSRGTVAVVQGAGGGTTDLPTVMDSDLLTPGKNAIPIGTLPVGLTSDESGCFMMSASAASCDLVGLDVTSALKAARGGDSSARVGRQAITNAAGELMRAKPRTLVGGAQTETIGLACPERPSGLLYLAYPACHLVTVVDAESGQIQAGLQFAEDGTVTVTDGNVTCPSECGDGSITPEEMPGGALPGPPPDAGVADAGPAGPDAGPPTTDETAPRPVALHMGSDGRLYIASENSPIIAAIALDETGMPTGTPTTVQLEGAVGVTAMAVSDLVEKGGSISSSPGSFGETRYLYAVATDRTVRVVDVETMVECDTQVDPRLIHDVRDVPLLSCFPVGGAETPARRPGAISPGIAMPLDEAPLDVAFARVAPDDAVPAPAPQALSGTFAYVTTTRGFVYIVNVDDDVYDDFEHVLDTANPDPDYLARVSMPLALAHQLRDAGGDRGRVAQACNEEPDPTVGGPRAADPPEQVPSTEQIAAEKLHLMPSVRQLECSLGDQDVPVSELAFAAPVATRELAFPDWRMARNLEQWTFVWEGPLSQDTALSQVDGPAVRAGVIEIDPENRYIVSLVDPSGSFCQLGVEKFDSVQLLGCDPTLGDSQCGLDETCYVHPDAPAAVANGVCLPRGRTDELSVPCRDFLITRRQYSAFAVSADRLTLLPRRRVLRTSPVDGCASDDQCKQMALVEAELADPADPIDLASSPPPLVDYNWVCTDDPTRPPAPNRCLMACESTAQCEAGNICLAGFCYEGVPPGAECVEAVQRYLVRATDAFVVIGSLTGYLHNRVKDLATGECVADPTANPLLVGRIPLRPPPCAEGSEDNIAAIVPNPCRVAVEQTELWTRRTPLGQQCVAQAQEQRTRTVDAVEFQNPAFRLHLVDTETQGDLTCNGDRLGGTGDTPTPAFSAVYPGFALRFTINGGLGGVSMQAPLAVQSTFPSRIVRAPDKRLWVVDQGDQSGSSGRLYRVTPSEPALAPLPIL